MTAEDYAAEAIANAEAERLLALFPPLDPHKAEDDFRDVPNALVRLDVAILAMNLMLARLTTRRIPGLLDRRLRKLKHIAGNVAGGWIIGKAFKQIVKPLGAVADAMDAQRVQDELSEAIVAVAVEVIADVKQHFLGARRLPRERKTRRVWSRIGPKRKQRRPNKSWTNPPAH